MSVEYPPVRREFVTEAAPPRDGFERAGSQPQVVSWILCVALAAAVAALGLMGRARRREGRVEWRGESGAWR